MSGAREFNHLFIITHTDLDGVGAAAVALKLLGRDEDSSTIAFAEPYNIDSVISELEGAIDRGDLLLISDIGVNSSVFENVSRYVRELAGKGVIVEWYDHHVWAPAEIEALEKAGARVVVDRSTCATGVVAKYLLGPDALDSDKFLRELVDAVCSADLWLWRHPLSPKLFRVVGERKGGEDWKRKLAYKFSKGILWDEEMEEKLVEYIDMELAGFKRALGNTYLGESKGVKIAVVYKDWRGPPSSSMIGALAMSRFEADIAAIVRSDGGLSLRSRKYNVQVLARMLGGGGHPRAAGAKLDLPLLVRIMGIIYPRLVSYYSYRKLRGAVERLAGSREFRVSSEE